MFKGFREFVLRGNVVDLAVGVVIGAAFGTVVSAFVKDLLTPVIAAIVKKPDFSGLYFRAERLEVSSTAISSTRSSRFVLVAAAVYYFVVLPVNHPDEALREAGVARQKEMPGQCQSDIPIEATRCAFCTQPVSA